jgi:uncharacterized protein involved in exopolysaccharide biosynthesis
MSAAASEQASRFSAREALSAAFSYKRRMLLALVLPPVVAVILIFLWPPTYRAQTTLIVKTGREYLPQGTLDMMQSGPTVTKLEDINSEMELMQDRTVIEDAINQVGIENLYPEVLGPSFSDYLPSRGSPMDKAVKKFNSHLDIKLVKMSNVLDVTFDDERQAMATKALESYLAAYINRHTAVFTSGRAGSFLTTIDRDQAELQRLELEQARIKLDNRIYDITPQRQSLISQRVDAETHLQETIDRKATLEQRVAYLDGIREGLPRTLTSSETSPNEEVVQANAALTALRQTESALLGRYSPQNPDVRRVQDQVNALQRRIAELKGSASKINVAPAALSQQVEQELVMDRTELAPLAEEAGRYKLLITVRSNELQRLEAADTDLRIVQSRIDALLDNLKAIRAQYVVARTQDDMDARRLASVVPVGPVLTPDKPAQPMPVLFAAAGVLLGLIAAGGLAVWAAVANAIFFTADGVEAMTGLPVLASVPLLVAPRKKASLR